MSVSSRRKRRHARFKHRTQPGAPPVMLIPDPTAAGGALQALAYGPEQHVETTLTRLPQLTELMSQWPVTWLNVDGLGDTVLISQVGSHFGFHRLALEDVIHTHQRAKVESYDNHFFIVVRMPVLSETCDVEQISIFLGPRFVVTFQERPGGDCLDPVRVRIRTGVSRLRCSGSDYLVYSLLDAIIDQYFPLVERCGERLDAIEEEILTDPRPDVVPQLHDVKRDLLVLHRSIWPLRDAMANLLRADTRLISDETRVYLRDCSDHIIQLLDLVESYRDLASSLTDLHLSNITFRTNEVMRVLTVISTIFMPLTFIAGVYGMNFDPDASFWNMPELRWPLGYLYSMLLMGAIAAAQLVFYWRLGWLQNPLQGARRKSPG